MDKKFEELYPVIDEHLKTIEGLITMMRVVFETDAADNPDFYILLEAKLPKPVSYPISPNSNPLSINQ